MRVEDYTYFGGVHFESANLKNLMAWAGVENPHTGKPFTEAECLGIAGGIAAGYQWCPSVLGYEAGSGVSVVPRVKMYSTNSVWYRDFFERIGIAPDVRETGGAKAAMANMCEPIEAGQPVVVACSPMKISRLGTWTSTCGMYSVVVHAVDKAAGTASIGDSAATSRTLPLEDLMWSRNRVCSLKNRTLTFARPKPIGAAQVKKAYEAGLRECAADFARPRLGTFNLPGLEEWTKIIANGKSKRGWIAAFPGARIYWPLRDAFDAIETAGTGGGLMRNLYAEFLEGAAAALKRPALAECAAKYRALAKNWTDFADQLLPEKVKPFALTKKLLRKREAAYTGKGEKGMKDVEAAAKQLKSINDELTHKFPWDDALTAQHLQACGEALRGLFYTEQESAALLGKAVGKAF
ncbi:MAG: DUF4872 domain-containing protein [Acidobacteriota bacterium]